MNGLMIRADESGQGAVLAVDARARMKELLDAFLTRRSEMTRRAYEADLKDFARHVESESVQGAVYSLISEGAGKANSKALMYKGALIESGKSPATVNRRLSALRSVVALARTLGIVAWALEVPNEKTQAYKDTRGPERNGVKAMLAEIQGDSPKAKRDRALIRLLYDLALRRGEAASLRVEDVDLAGRRVWVKGKGRNGEREALTLPEKTAAVLAEWIQCRGAESGPLFITYHRAGKGGRLSDRALYYVIHRAGERVGIETRPHGLRHSSITAALDLTGDIRQTQKFSRHRNPQTLLRYDDNREDLFGKVAAVVSSAV